MLLLCSLIIMRMLISSLWLSRAKDLLLPLQEESPLSICLCSLCRYLWLYWGGEHHHVKVCRFKMVGFSGDVRNDWSLSGSFSSLSFVCLVIELSFGENTHEDRATKFQTMQPQVSRTCSFWWIDTYLFFFFFPGDEWVLSLGLDFLGPPWN